MKKVARQSRRNFVRQSLAASAATFTASFHQLNHTPLQENARPGKQPEYDLRDTEWALADVMPLIRSVPDASFMIWNVANSTRLEDSDVNLIRRGSVLMDTSGRSTNQLSGLIDQFGVEKFAFGSHAPILDYVTSRLRIEYLDADEKIKDQLRFKNAARMLQLK